ncbi:hypothetical protein NLO93_28485, partial [Pseudomonas savastanoi]|nr:hypothetical protein [Pseudomonas savastanoi]
MGLMTKLKSMFLLLRDRKNGRFAAAGCPVPFSASVSIQAAALGFDAAMAWAGDYRWPGLSTRVLSRAHEP